MQEMEDRKQPEHLMKLAMECMGVAVTIIDTKGTLVYYNRRAAELPVRPLRSEFDPGG